VSASAGDVERPLTVMIVDNSDDYRQLAVGVLAADGYDVIAASDGREALDLLRDRVQTNAILVLTGLAMPSFSGRRLLDEIEREGWSQFVLVVVITGAHEPVLELGVSLPSAASRSRRSLATARSSIANASSAKSSTRVCSSRSRPCADAAIRARHSSSTRSPSLILRS
jgi:CheY-like chemotaxis protein